MGIAQLVYHYLITTHHGSHYDWHIWQWWANHPATYPLNSAIKRVESILAHGGI